MTDIERLIHILDIQQLKARYFRTLDTKDWPGLEAVFAPDAVIDFRESMGQPADQADQSMLTHGASALVAKLAPVLGDVLSVHHGYMPEITLESPTTARGIWAMDERLRAEPGSVMPFKWMDAYGHYHERYVRLENGWRIKELRLTRLRVDMG
jgi:hypothetical protein